MATAKTAKTAAKKTVTPRQVVKVKVIQTVDSPLGKDTTVFFTDGTHAVITDKKLSQMLVQPENVAPNMIQVTMSRGQIIAAERVDTGGTEA